jgi:tetratricopeptide (TPR) repeat protein
MAQAIGATEYNVAIQVLEQALKKDNTDYFAMSMLAQCHEWSDNMDCALDYAQKLLDNEPDNFSMLLLAARHWQRKGNEDRTYLFACKALVNPPPPMPEAPQWLFWLFKPLSLIPKFRNFEMSAKSDFEKLDHENIKNLIWAEQYKAWYEDKYKTKATTTTLH